jgi:hypothetical protein
MERLDHSLLFRRFVGLRMGEPVWDATNRGEHLSRMRRGLLELFEKIAHPAAVGREHAQRHRRAS